MTATQTKTLRLDSTDLKWLSERLDTLDGGNPKIDSATIRFAHLDHIFRAKRVERDDEYDGHLVLELVVKA